MTKKWRWPLPILKVKSSHLEGEANQWWQWLRRAYGEEKRIVTC